MSEHPAFDPDWCMAPGCTLAELLADYHLSLRTAARILDMDETDLDAILLGAEPITGAIASRLQMAFGVSSDLWLALERQYREGLAAGKKDVTHEDGELRTRRARRAIQPNAGARQRRTDNDGMSGP